MSIESFLAEYGNTLVLFILFQLILALISNIFKGLRSRNWTKPIILISVASIAWINYTVDIFGLGFWQMPISIIIVILGVIVIAKK